MTTISDAHLFGGNPRPHGEALQCHACQTDRHLIIHSIDTLAPPAQGLVSVTYTCEGCGQPHSQQASVSQIADVLNRPGPSAAADVLQFGGEYIHCGQPMHTANTEMRNIYSPVTTEPAAAGLLDIYLSTRVLRCDCGFQMEIPR